MESPSSGPYRFGGWKSKVNVALILFLVRIFFLAYRQCLLTVSLHSREKGLWPLPLFLEGHYSHHRTTLMTSPNPNHLSKAPPLNDTLTFVVMVSTYKSGVGGTQTFSS